MPVRQSGFTVPKWARVLDIQKSPPAVPPIAARRAANMPPDAALGGGVANCTAGVCLEALMDASEASLVGIGALPPLPRLPVAAALWQSRPVGGMAAPWRSRTGLLPSQPHTRHSYSLRVSPQRCRRPGRGPGIASDATSECGNAGSAVLEAAAKELARLPASAVPPPQSRVAFPARCRRLPRRFDWAPGLCAGPRRTSRVVAVVPESNSAAHRSQRGATAARNCRPA